MRRIQILLTGAMVLGFVLAGTARSEAALIAWVCSTQDCSAAGDVMVVDNGAGDNLDTSDGAIAIVLANFFGYEIVVNTSQSKPAIGSAALPQMDITYTITNTTGSAGSIWLYALDTDFTGDVTLHASLDGNASFSNFSLTGGVWGGNSNLEALDFTNQLISLGPATSSPYSLTGSAPVNASVNPYALLIGLRLDVEGNATGTATGDLLVTSVPEPASVLLLGFALLGGGAAMRRRNRSRA